ncbi:MAG: GspE/PulE family protein [bacterium]|nr:GspE/PulE family protein [bacterium]
MIGLMAQFLKTLDDQLLKIRHEAEEKDAQKKAYQAGVAYLNLTTAPIQIDALKALKEEDARRLLAAVFQSRENVVALAVYDPKSVQVADLVKRFEAGGQKVKLFQVSLSGLAHIWDFYKFIPPPSDEITGKVAIEESRVIELKKQLTDLDKIKKAILDFDFKTFPTGQILEVVLAGAMNNRASDIHFEAEDKGIRLRLRVDGNLQDVITGLSKDIYKFLVSRIKLLSNLKLNINNAPQDGRFTIVLEKADVEMRVSIIPSEFGETIVMRILDPSAIRLTLPQLGMRKDDLAIIQEELKKPNGMILNTGPTGSGKTTTLYAFLLSKVSSGISIITIEDPIEYHLQGVEQTQTDPEAGYDFASGLRSIMRQDPDVILVGEVRDKETGDIAIQAALTGHLVFSTLHANSAAGAIPRFLDLGVKSGSLGPAMDLIIAQRLVRVLCENCKVPEKLSAELEARIRPFLVKLPKRVDRKDYEKPTMFKPKGCPKCLGIGYRGRIAIVELLLVDEGLEEMIKPEIGESVIQKYAVKQGMVTMQQDGILKTLAGTTTFDEVEGVTGPLQW